MLHTRKHVAGTDKSQPRQLFSRLARYSLVTFCFTSLQDGLDNLSKNEVDCQRLFVTHAFPLAVRGQFEREMMLHIPKEIFQKDLHQLMRKSTTSSPPRAKQLSLQRSNDTRRENSAVSQGQIQIYQAGKFTDRLQNP
ncbi:hypothetical protein NPIL_195801 [Nephila pilipes]|uniref:Uncharacterized protein n=1 Tax=Nephila pilipes TaxID=299642 RepID=A0A8X6NGR0_NEPPI|nr:hypothetical protein NPIL_195801 [Nephila pilipes]